MSTVITVVVTAYNIEKYIVKCLDSILEQTYRDFHVIVVDDGSADRTGYLASEYCRKHDGFSYYHQENAGVSVARNYGIDHAEGDFIAFVDGDDYLDCDYLEKLLAAITSDSIDIVCSGCHAFLEDSREEFFYDRSYTMTTEKEKERLYLQLFNGNYGKPKGRGATAIGVPWGKLYRRKMVQDADIRFDPALKRMQDNMFNMYAFYHADTVVYINEAHYNYRLEHITSRNTRYKYDIWLNLLKAREEFFEKYPGFLTPSLLEGKLYELNVAFASSLRNIAKSSSLREALAEYEALRKDPLFKDLFSGKKSRYVPMKLKSITALMKLRAYFVVIQVLKRM